MSGRSFHHRPGRSTYQKQNGNFNNLTFGWVISEYLSIQVYFPIHTLYRQHTVSVPSHIYTCYSENTFGPEIGGPGYTHFDLRRSLVSTFDSLWKKSDKNDRHVMPCPDGRRGSGHRGPSWDRLSYPVMTVLKLSRISEYEKLRFFGTIITSLWIHVT